MSTAEKGEIADLTAEELVAEREWLDHEIRKAEKTVAYFKGERNTVDAYLSRALEPGTGEVIVAPSGRIVTAEWAPSGSATVNKAALDEYAAVLPDDLKPRSVTAYTGVTEIRKAAKEGRLPKGVTLSDLLIEPPKAKKVRWRTPQEDDR